MDTSRTIERNLLVMSAVGALHVAMLFILPLVLDRSLWWATIFVLLFWVNVTHWGLIHEAIHKLLHPHNATNEWMGRTLSVVFGTSFHMLRFGHLMHHKLNRSWSSEYRRADAGWLEQLRYYYGLLLGLYVSEIMTSLLMAVLPRTWFMRIARATVARNLPELAVAGERYFYVRGHATQVQVDTACVVLLYGAAFWLYGSYWPVLLGLLTLRGATVSFFDNLYHYGTPADNSKAAKELVLPAAISRAFLHGNYHETHHLNPNIPWHELPDTHRSQSRSYDGKFINAGLQQFNGFTVHAA